MKKAILCVLLTLAMSVNAFALEVPTDTVVQNLNGSQQAIKTYTIPPDQDPATLIEEPFELEGYLYTFANIVKTENPVEESKVHTEVVTVKTSKKDLSVVLENLEPTIEYDDGVFKGRLALDHTSIVTEAAGYTSKSYTVTETKTIGQLDIADCTWDGTETDFAGGNAEIKELVSILRCGNFSGYCCLGGGAVYPDDLNEAAENFRVLLKNM